MSVDAVAKFVSREGSKPRNRRSERLMRTLETQLTRMHNAPAVRGCTAPVPLMISFGELRQDAEKLLACAAILPLRRRGHRSARDLALQLERRELLDAHPVERLEGLDGDEAAVVHQPRHERVHVLLDHRDLVRLRVRLGVGVRVRVSLGFTLALTLT